MGQFEKIVVLIAFFLVTVILLVTFNSPSEEGLILSMGEGNEVAAADTNKLGDSSTRDPEGEMDEEQAQPALPVGPGPLARDLPSNGSNPRRSERGASNGATAFGAGENGLAADEGSNLGGQGLQDLSRKESQGRDLLLDDSFSARAPQSAALPEGAALVTLEGLTSTFDASIMEYTWRRGDNWSLVAERLYGDKSKQELLRQFNEGSNYHAPGERILVPVFDGRDVDVASTSTPNTNSSKSSPKEDPDKKELSEERGNLYRVVDGDSLWVISKKVYGKGSQWEKIYDANKDILASPDDVKPGMGLRIP